MTTDSRRALSGGWLRHWMRTTGTTSGQVVTAWTGTAGARLVRMMPAGVRLVHDMPTSAARAPVRQPHGTSAATAWGC